MRLLSTCVLAGLLTFAGSTGAAAATAGFSASAGFEIDFSGLSGVDINVSAVPDDDDPPATGSGSVDANVNTVSGPVDDVVTGAVESAASAGAAPGFAGVANSTETIITIFNLSQTPITGSIGYTIDSALSFSSTGAGANVGLGFAAAELSLEQTETGDDGNTPLGSDSTEEFVVVDGAPLPSFPTMGMNTVEGSFDELELLPGDSFVLTAEAFTGGNASVLPLPGALAFMITGLAGLGYVARRRR